MQQNHWSCSSTRSLPGVAPPSSEKKHWAFSSSRALPGNPPRAPAERDRPAPPKFSQGTTEPESRRPPNRHQGHAHYHQQAHGFGQFNSQNGFNGHNGHHPDIQHGPPGFHGHPHGAGHGLGHGPGPGPGPGHGHGHGHRYHSHGGFGQPPQSFGQPSINTTFGAPTGFGDPRRPSIHRSALGTIRETLEGSARRAVSTPTPMPPPAMYPDAVADTITNLEEGIDSRKRRPQNQPFPLAFTRNGHEPKRRRADCDSQPSTDLRAMAAKLHSLRVATQPNERLQLLSPVIRTPYPLPNPQWRLVDAASALDGLLSAIPDATSREVLEALVHLRFEGEVIATANAQSSPGELNAIPTLSPGCSRASTPASELTTPWGTPGSSRSVTPPRQGANNAAGASSPTKGQELVPGTPYTSAQLEAEATSLLAGLHHEVDPKARVRMILPLTRPLPLALGCSPSFAAQRVDSCLAMLGTDAQVTVLGVLMRHAIVARGGR